jgi:rhodanese-related sulfurtransferase
MPWMAGWTKTHVLLVPSMLLLGACSPTAQAPTSAPTVLGVRTVTAARAVAMLDSYTAIDVRDPDEYATGHIAGAVNIPVEAADYGARIAELEPDDPYLVYRRFGRRSALAADLMAAAGHTDVVDAGAYAALVEAGAPTG